MIATVVPAILAKSEREFKEKLAMIERAAPLVQIDAMDGKFVPNTTWADPLEVAHMKTPAQFEIHLMVEEPFREVILWGKLKNVKRVIVHAESTKLLRELLHTIRATGKEAGLAINPATPLRKILPYLDPLASSRASKASREISDRDFSARSRDSLGRNDEKGGMVDFLLIMSNDPGFSGRSFRPSTLKRIAALRKQFPKLPIGIDIGVDEHTAPLLHKAGATHIAAASAVFGAPDPVVAYRNLVRAFK